ncbi:hypothetical protein CQW23_24242 [Capsicum baccatum]|uniref:Uncharacterized protein n=1 Tax=Capsicum baccatum TaxID=33114 RepID=A0A2G2VUA6_CAPBA|nr:hypothetical protein CQW23_24242 [Capsicum baccatum]
MMDGKCKLGSPKTKVERALGRNGLLRIPVQKLRDSRRIKHGVIQMFLIYRECAKILNQDRVLDITAHPKKTSPVVDDNKVGEHDTGDNEMDFIDESDDDLQYDDFDSNVTETSYEFCKKDKRSC